MLSERGVNRLLLKTSISLGAIECAPKDGCLRDKTGFTSITGDRFREVRPFSVAFRADASLLIGNGHVMRCLTLADALKRRGARTVFIGRRQRGDLLDLLGRHGHEVLVLPQVTAPVAQGDVDALAHASWLGADWQTDAADTLRVIGQYFFDWLVVDHYAIDHRWERLLRPHCRHLMAIDDLADRRHDCDLLLDQNLGRVRDDYASLVPAEATLLLGPAYALLRPEFPLLRTLSLSRREVPESAALLVTMGGVDKDNVTADVLRVLASVELPESLRIEVVLGPHAPHLAEVKALAAEMPRPARVFAGDADMAGLMAECDLAIGAAGSTAWERCCLGLPSIQYVLADNQRSIAAALERAGAAVTVTTARLPEVLKTLLVREGAAERVRCMANRASALTDGLGVLKVIDRINGSLE